MAGAKPNAEYGAILVVMKDDFVYSKLLVEDRSDVSKLGVRGLDEKLSTVLDEAFIIKMFFISK